VSETRDEKLDRIATEVKDIFVREQVDMQDSLNVLLQLCVVGCHLAHVNKTAYMKIADKAWDIFSRPGAYHLHSLKTKES